MADKKVKITLKKSLIGSTVKQKRIAKALGFTKTELGLLGSSLYLTYAFGKFINGVIADNTNAKRILPTALSSILKVLHRLSVRMRPS